MRKRSLAAAVLGALALVGSLLVATPPAQALNDTGTGGVFVPATGRILDTQAGTGGYSTPMPAGTYRTIKVAGLFGLPDDGSVGAVSLNATVAASSGAGTLAGRPDADSGATTMLIYSGVKGEFTSNTATIAVGADGTIQVMANTNARLILDVQGYYTANTDGTASGGFVPVAKRIVDTRSGLGAAKATIAPGKSIDVQITGANGIPSGASGVVVNLIAINSTDSDGYLTPYATGGTKPQNALHYAPSVTTSAQAQVPLSSGGKITIANGSATANLVIDVQGYFTAAGTDGAVFTPSYGRAYDSRASGNTALANGETRSIQIAGKGGVPVMGSGITAVTLTLIVSHAGSAGYAEAWADGTSKPGTTAINFQADDIRTNTITVPLGANGKIALRNVADATDYIVDVQGWYANPLAPTISCPAPYQTGTWSTAIPSTPITCTVTTKPAYDSDSVLSVTSDGVGSDDIHLSATSPTSTQVKIPASGGEHVIYATTNDANDFASTTSFAIGLGDWAHESITPTPASGSQLWIRQAGLNVAPDNDVLGDDASVEYSVSLSPDGTTSPIIEGTADANGLTLDQDQLQVGTTYYWTAKITGMSGGRTTPDTVQTPVWSFVATDTVTAADGTQVAGSDAVAAVAPIEQDQAKFAQNKDLDALAVADRMTTIEANYQPGDALSEEDLEFLKLYKFENAPDSATPSAMRVTTQSSSETVHTGFFHSSADKKFNVSKSQGGRKVAVKGTIHIRIGIVNNSWACDITSTRKSGKTTSIQTGCEIQAFGLLSGKSVGVVYSRSPHNKATNVSPYHFSGNEKYQGVILSVNAFYNVKVSYRGGNFQIYG